MALTALPDGYISDDFEFPYGTVVFSDALVLPATVYNSMTQAEIEAMKQKRFDDWVALIEAPPVVTDDQEIYNG